MLGLAKARDSNKCQESTFFHLVQLSFGWLYSQAGAPCGEEWATSSSRIAFGEFRGPVERLPIPSCSSRSPREDAQFCNMPAPGPRPCGHMQNIRRSHSIQITWLIVGRSGKRKESWELMHKGRILGKPKQYVSAMVLFLFFNNHPAR